MTIPTPSRYGVSAAQAVNTLLADIGGPEAGDRVTYGEMDSLDDMAQRMLVERYDDADLCLVDTGDEWLAEPAAYMDAVRASEDRGTDWQHAYVLDRGWDATSIAATANDGISDEDADALGPHADGLERWCRRHPAAHADDPSEYDI